MYAYNILFQYTLAAVGSLVCFVMIMIQRKDNLKEKKVYSSTVIFISNIAAIGLLSSFFYTQEIIFRKYDVTASIRGLDYFLYAVLLFSWLNLLQQLCTETGEKVHAAEFNAGKIFSLFSIVVFTVLAVIYMDDFYFIENHIALVIYRLSEIGFALISTLIISICTIRNLSFILMHSTRVYVITSSAAVSIYFLSNIWLASVIGTVTPLSWNNDTFDFSGWLLLTMNIITGIFIYKKDFQQLYNRSDKQSSDIITDVLDSVSQEHKLTHREREILELAYKGATNAEIAEKLFISLNTVKTHMKSIFEKTGVSSRIELAYIINQQLYDKFT